MESKAILYRQNEANYSTVSPQTGTAQCANCRLFTPSEDGGYCQIVEPYPDNILATGYCDQWVQLPAVEDKPMEVAIVEIEVEMAHQGLDQPSAAGTLGKVLRRKEEGVTFFKGDDGLRMALIVGSNGYKDRDNEHIATAALQEYVDSQWQGDEWQGDNKVKFWHLVDIGDVAFAAMVNGFLVEVAKERAGLLPRILWDYLEDNPDEIEWGASIGFKMLEPKDDDTFRHIDKRETSILPREAASNVITLSEVIDMSNRSDLLERILGVSEAAALLKEGKVGELNKRLAAAGHQAKEVKPDATETDEDTVTKAPDFTELVSKLAQAVVDVIESQGEVDERLSTVDKTLADMTTAREKATTDQQAGMDALRTELADIKAILTDEPRASKSARTLVTDADKKAELDKAHEEERVDPMFGKLIDPNAVDAFREARNGNK